MVVEFQGKEYRVTYVWSVPGEVSIETEDGVFLIKGKDIDNKDFREIMIAEEQF